MSTGSRSLKLANRSASVNRGYFCQIWRKSAGAQPSQSDEDYFPASFTYPGA